MAFTYPPCTYRVSAKAAIVIGGKLLLVKEETEQWELPGGGIEHREDLAAAVRREVAEETGLQLSGVDDEHVLPWLTYDEQAGRPLIFLVVRAMTDQTIEAGAFGDVEIGFFGERELASLPLVPYIDRFRDELTQFAFNG